MVSSCSTKKKEIINFSNNYTAIVEIPAGTNKKFEYNYSTKTFEIETKNGVERTINYLPYPGNYGFISNTYMDPEIGGDGDALDVLIISESIQQGKKIEISPIAILRLLDRGQEDHKVIATLKIAKSTFQKTLYQIQSKQLLKLGFVITKDQIR